MRAEALAPPHLVHGTAGAERQDMSVIRPFRAAPQAFANLYLTGPRRSRHFDPNTVTPIDEQDQCP